MNLQIPLTTMIANIDRRIAFQKARGDYDDQVAVVELGKLRAEYEARIARGEIMEDVI